MNGFKNMISGKLVSLITEWLDKKFMVIYQANSMRLYVSAGCKCFNKRKHFGCG